jgi:hypothetical protein
MLTTACEPSWLLIIVSIVFVADAWALAGVTDVMDNVVRTNRLMMRIYRFIAIIYIDGKISI